MSNSLVPWIQIPKDSDFSIHNLPFGIFSTEAKSPRIGIAVGSLVLDLLVFQKIGLLNDLEISPEVIEQDSLNAFIRLGKKKTNAVRKRVKEELCNEDSLLKTTVGAFDNKDAVTMHLPVKVGDYTDFYSSIEHATNIGKMFRDPENALLPNWKHLPVGYHGRASSIIVSGQDIHRPKGQTRPDDAKPPVFGPTKRLDFELEMAFIIGKDSELGDSVTVDDADDYIFGMVIFNDWSARDIQKWEYVPLGPFLGKSFASSVSPWVVPMEALQPFRMKGPKQDPPVLSYLEDHKGHNYDINLSVELKPEDHAEFTTLCKTNYKWMYWSMAQQLAHHTVNGCNVRIGDMMASGTISGESKDSFGSMLELSWAGSEPISLNGNHERKFLEDGDTVRMRGYAEKDGIRVGFGEVHTSILPAK